MVRLSVPVIFDFSNVKEVRRSSRTYDSVVVVECTARTLDVPPFSMAFKLLKMEGIEISGAKVELTREIEPGIIIDYDTNGHINRYRGAFSGQEGNS
nr:MAG: Protein of unknown function (DUF2283) [Candidatus Kentron sp. SD]